MTNKGVQRRLAAILAADVVGYSRLMEADEAGTHARLKAFRAQFMEPTIAEHHGRIVKLTGDGALVEFASVVDAIECALAIQRGVTELGAETSGGQGFQLRIGVNLGDIIVEDEDIYGGGVNVAARLESLAEPGGILISGTAYDHVEGKLDCGFEYLGEKEVKNLERPVRAYRVMLDQGGGALSAMPIVAVGHRWSGRAGVAAAILVVLGTAGWLQPWRSPERAAVEPGSEASLLNTRRLAVLPFANISADPDNEYFSDGLTEELISQLSRIGDLSVIARTSVIGYKNTDKRIDEIGRELQAGTILEGSVRKAGNQVRITAQLIDAATQAHLWSEDYSRQFEDIFAIQAEIARHVADTLRVTLLASTRDQISRQRTENLEAYNLYLRGRYFLNQYTKKGLDKAMEYFQQALVEDPNFVLAHAGISHALNQMFWNGGMQANEAYPRAKEAAQRALALDETTAEAWTALALAELDYYWNWAAAESALERALALNPSDAMAHELYGHRLLSAVQGRYDEAIAEMNRALELNPLS